MFAETHLYSLTSEDGTKDARIESELSKIEDQAARILKRILTSVNAGVLPNLSEKDKAVWNEFFYLQWKRTPEHLHKTLPDNYTEAMLDELLNEFEIQNDL